MDFTTLYSVIISTRKENQNVLAKVVKTRDTPYFDLRIYNNEKPTINGVFIDPVEYFWFQKEINSGNKKTHTQEKRTVTIEQQDEEVEISLKKEGNPKKSIKLNKEEVVALVKELEKITKIITE
jgi:hypothetical protein